MDEGETRSDAGGEGTRPRVLLTNDDGIDAAGIRVLAAALEPVASVTVVAPVADRSSVGRSISDSVEVESHEDGYAVDGTPADCVVAGLAELCPAVDLVVSGCNGGANLGQSVLGRSGTVGAAIEAGFFGVPAIAVSLYLPPSADRDWRERADDPAMYAEASRVTAYLVERTLGTAVFESADYLNVNVPPPADEPAPMAATRPSTVHDMTASWDGTHVSLTDNTWARMRDGALDDQPGTDRHAVVEGRVSVSPLSASHAVDPSGALERLSADYA